MMSTFRRACRLSFVALILSPTLPGLFGQLPSANPVSVGMDASRLGRVTGVLSAAIENEEIPGAVALVARRGRVVYRTAVGYRSVAPGQEPMTTDTIFDLASLTKVVATATSIMILVEEGRVALTDKITDYLPDFDRYGKDEVTLVQLLTHYSGLRPDLDLKDPWEGYETAMKLARQERLVADPGEEFIYSDINYLILAEIVREVSGVSVEEFSRIRVFEPLRMADTRFRPGPELRDRIAPTVQRDGRMLRGQVHDPTTYRVGGVAGHAGLYSTADDIAVWAQMILNGGVYHGRRILSPLSVLAMTTPQSPPEKLEWRGLGFDIASRYSTTRGDLFPVGSFGHTGFTGTSVWIDPYSETMVLLFTSRLHPQGEGDVVSLRRRVASVVAASILDAPLNRAPYYVRY